MAGQPDPVEPSSARRRAEDAADRGEVSEAVMWSLVSIAGDVAALRRVAEREARRNSVHRG